MRHPASTMISHLLGLALLALAGTANASLSHRTHSHHNHNHRHAPESSHLQPQHRASALLRPGQLCDPSSPAANVGPSCALRRCDPVSVCLLDGTCGNHCEYLLLGDTGCQNDGECLFGGCQSSKCTKVVNGGNCHLHQNCESGLCDDGGTCVESSPDARDKYDPGHICVSADDCVSGQCSDSLEPVRVCRGGVGICEEVSRCTGFRLGQACADSTRCSRGVCKSGVCAYAALGESCLRDAQCHSERCHLGKCVALAGGETCKYGADCSTGTCTPTGNAIVPGICARNAAGGPCRDPRDCISGACPGTCAASAGEACTTSPQCASFKCRSGKCAPAAAGQACGADAHCLSASCEPDAGMQQCVLYGCFTPTVCARSLRGGACYDDRDCRDKSWCQPASASAETGTCVAGSRPTATPTSTSTSSPQPNSSSGTGSLKPLGASCTTNTLCKSEYCRKPLLADKVTRASTGTCDTRNAAGGKCYQNGGCLSGACNKAAGICQ